MKRSRFALALVFAFYAVCVAAVLSLGGGNVSAAVVLAAESAAEEQTDGTGNETAKGNKETEEAAETARPEYHALDYVILGDYKGLSIEEPTQEEILLWLEQNGYTASEEETDSAEDAATEADTEAASADTPTDEEREEARDALLKSQLLVQVTENAQITGYPQELLDYTVENLRSYYSGLGSMVGLSAEEYISQYLGLTDEEFTEEAEGYAREDLSQELILKAVAETEGISVSDEEYEKGCLAYAESTGYDSVERLVGVYGEGQIRISLLQEKVLDFLLEEAVVQG